MTHDPQLLLAIGGLGPTELLVILAIVILLFGGSKLPVLGRSLGEGINNFRRAFKEDEDVQVAEVAPPVETSEANASTQSPDPKTPIEDKSQNG